MEHTERTAALLRGLTAQFPGLKPMEEGELPAFVALCRSNDFYNSISMDEPPSLESCREDLTALPPGRGREHKLFLGLWQQGHLQAVLDLVEGYPDEETLYIGLLELDTSCQGQGLGTALVKALAQESFQAGFSLLRLACLEANTPGLGFWQSMGFTQEGTALWSSGNRPVRKLVRNLNEAA
ncbi:MAG: GNAT family N-acetyltransferase [Acutalibacter sp.]|jgi:ribosomal protein S18 acetylase RimI-like enzyme